MKLSEKLKLSVPDDDWFKIWINRAALVFFSCWFVYRFWEVCHD